MGQIDAPCRTCHSAETFKISSYEHDGLSRVFKGLHRQLECRSCHKTETGEFPAGRGTAMRFTVGRTCAACHSQFFGVGVGDLRVGFTRHQ